MASTVKQDPVCLVVQVQCGDQLVERVIEEKIDQFYGWVEKHPGRRGQVKAVRHDSHDCTLFDSLLLCYILHNDFAGQ